MTTETIETLRTASESELRELKVGHPKSREELQALIDALLARPHDYGSAVYAMSIAATATFDFVANQLGATGFQASCADMDILRRTRHLPGPFMLVDGANALYPLYDLQAQTSDFLGGIQGWLRDQAREKLSQDLEHVHQNVVAHWQKLAEYTDEV